MNPHSGKTLLSYTQCKRKVHNMNFDNVLGQQVSELLGEAIRQDNWAKPCETYTVRAKAHAALIEMLTLTQTYLLTWHHMECYLSRLEVSQKYIHNLGQDKSKNLQKGPHPLVERSRKFYMKDHKDRRDWMLLAAHVQVEQLSKYERHYSSQLVQRLTGRW